MKYLVVVPTYNEAENIVKLIDEIFALAIEQLSILVVDDNSPDHTAELVEELKNKYPDKLFLAKRSGKLGLGSAYQFGFAWALDHGYNFAFSMDADFSHNPQDLVKLMEVSKDYDIVLASRKIPGGKIIGWNWRRYLASHGAMALSRLILWLKTHDVTAGFKCYSRRYLEFLLSKNIKSNGYAFQIETIYLAEKNKFTVKEIPTTFVDRKFGQSKLSSKDIIEFFINVIKLRF